MKQYGLIGFPLTHSFSKRFFTEKFAAENIAAKYDLFELDSISGFTGLLNTYELSGLNVTAPYKQQVIEYLDDLDETAAEIGAVNVIKFIRKNGGLRLVGYNSDAIGFERSLAPHLKDYHKKALILGSGGASKAVFYVLKKLGLETLSVSRTKQSGNLTYEMLDKNVLDDYKLIVNSSPVGTFPHVDECPQIPYALLDSEHFLFDLVYNPAETLFLKKGKEYGAKGINGMEMLVGQAKAAWEIWNF
ncbi:MAG: shikimate dehydrogenase [Prevotellaceae bacterium]|jgi:shikimate dehydrogenase|nr:shikimate dehydrogenase [Prevotellaceae bacterium]